MKLLDIYEKSAIFKGAKGGELPVETASMFVTGIMAREIFFPELAFTNNREGDSFEQLWFVLCLYHDTRMERARIWKRACRKRKNREIRRWESKNIGANGKWNPLHLWFSPLFHYVGDGIQFTNGTKVSECMISETEVRDYFYYRSMCCRDSGMDHGIAGGLLLYESLICRHLQQIGTPDRNALNLYSYAANTMLVHNIWQGGKSGGQITPEKDPLLFLLLLAEILEPLQYAITCADERQILSRIEVEITGRKICLEMDKNYFAIEKWEENLRSLEKKIKVDYKIWCETARICITL